MCERKANEPHRFCVLLPYEDCVFNRVVSLELMKLNGTTVLQIFDRDIRFGAACVLCSESTKALWEAFMVI